MGFNTDKKDQLKDSMDYDSNGRLNAIANKAATLDAPVLIIGLGGTGVDSVIKLKKVVYDRLKCEVAENGEIKDKPANIEYLVMDTSIENEKKVYQGIRFNPTLKESFIFTTPNVQKIINNKKPDYIESWLSHDITQATVLNGAGGVRQLGRLMLFMNIHEVVSTLESKIRRITASYKNNVPLYVFVLSGISGGTGSGTFIDIAYLVKTVADRVSAERPVNNVGILFLPDVNLSQPGLTDPIKENIRRNGFAALKELDYLMNVNETGDHFEQDYGMIKVGMDGNNPGTPFDVCILMSTMDKQGVTVQNAYEYTINVTAETVINFIASEQVSKDDDVSKFSIQEFLSNEVGNRSTFVGMLDENRHPINYIYSIAGASSAKLPMNDIMSYMTYLAFKEVEGLWNREPEETEVQELLELFGIEAQNLELTLCQSSPVRQNMSRHTYELIRQNSKLVIDDYESVLAQQKAYLNLKSRDMVADMQAKIEDPNNYLNDVFRDLNRGPVVAQQMLYTTRNHMCITNELKELSRYFLTNKPDSLILESLKTDASDKLNKLLTSKPLLPGSKAKLRDEFIKSCDAYYDAQYKVYAYDNLAAICNQYFTMFMDKNNAVYDCVADLLLTLTELFSKYGNIKTQTSQHMQGNTKLLSWDLINTPAFISELEKHMNKNDDLYVDLHAFITSFYTYLFENTDIWVGKERADVVERINTFISQSFENLLDKSMDYYVQFIALSEGKSLTVYIDGIFKKLENNANIMFPVGGNYHTVVQHPRYSYISVPDNAAAIKNGAQTHTNSNQSIIKSSGIHDSIYMMNFESAVPLTAYSELSVYHDAYVKFAPASPGLHLYENQKRNWRKLPSPYPESEWLSGHYINQEAEENAAIRTLFDKAKKYGYIGWDESSKKYMCFYGKLVDIKAILKAYGIEPDASMNDMNAAKRCVKALRSEMENRERLTGRTAIYDMKLLKGGAGELIPDEEYEKNLFIKMVAVRAEIAAMVENHEECLSVLEKLSGVDELDDKMLHYIRCIYTKTLTKRRGEYLYYNKQGMVQPFGELNGKQNNYQDYYLFMMFLNMEAADNKELVAVVEKNRSQLKQTDEGYEEMKESLNELLARLSDKISELNGEWREIDNGETILQTYRAIYDVADGESGSF